MSQISVLQKGMVGVISPTAVIPFKSPLDGTCSTVANICPHNAKNASSQYDPELMHRKPGALGTLP